MKKLKRLLRRSMKNSGFTLVELVISCGLLGILVLGVTAFIGPVLKSAADNEENVRATLLAQTMDEFVNRSIRDSYYVAIFTDAKKSDAYDGGDIAKNENLKAMKDFVDTNNDIYELKCFSYTWTEDPHGNEYKYMLMTEKFESASTSLESGGSIPVFENCFYDGLFPQIEIEQIKAEPADEDDSNVDEDGKVPVPATKTTYTVYTDQNSSLPAFIGVGYTEFSNVRADSDENKTKKFLFYGVKSMKDDEEEDEEEHLTTFIYYVARKPIKFEVTPSSTT